MHLHFEPFRMLEEMQHQVSTNPVDRIEAMAFLLASSTTPAYNKSQCLEDAWTALLTTSSVMTRGALFFWYPEPGNAGAKWRPCWDQVMKTPLPGYFSPLRYPFLAVDRDVQTNFDRCTAFCIENGWSGDEMQQTR